MFLPLNCSAMESALELAARTSGRAAQRMRDPRLFPPLPVTVQTARSTDWVRWYCELLVKVSGVQLALGW